jgi:hypothetical protein
MEWTYWLAVSAAVVFAAAVAVALESYFSTRPEDCGYHDDCERCYRHPDAPRPSRRDSPTSHKES